jgi:regulator of replication initiation timing
MCLFFATNMAAKYEHQKTETEIHRSKVKELEEKIHELSTINQELLQMRYALVQEKDRLTKEITALREKYAEAEDWKLTTKKETSPAIQSDTIAPTRKPEETQETSTNR